MSAPLQGFGAPIIGSESLADNVFFEILLARGDSLSQWAMQRLERSFPIPGSFPPKTIKQVVGWSNATVTWHLGLASIADYQRLHAWIGLRATLTVVAGVQAHPATLVPVGQITYDSLPGTTLLSLTNMQYFDAETVELDATFERTVHPVTLQLVVP
jgi:hypothetical protein